MNQASEEQAIRAAARDYQTAFNARDVDRLVALHTPDAVVMVSNSPLATGTTEIRRSFSEFLSPGTSLSFTPTRIDVVSPTVATVERSAVRRVLLVTGVSAGQSLTGNLPALIMPGSRVRVSPLH